MQNLNAFEMGVAKHLEIPLAQCPEKHNSAILFDDAQGDFEQIVADRIRSGTLPVKELAQETADIQGRYLVNDLVAFFERCLDQYK